MSLDGSSVLNLESPQTILFGPEILREECSRSEAGKVTCFSLFSTCKETAGA